jgi:hypothetical protein
VQHAPVIAHLDCPRGQLDRPCRALPRRPHAAHPPARAAFGHGDGGLRHQHRGRQMGMTRRGPRRAGYCRCTQGHDGTRRRGASSRQLRTVASPRLPRPGTATLLAATCLLVLRRRPGQAGVEVPGRSLSFRGCPPRIDRGCGSQLDCALPGIAARRGSRGVCPTLEVAVPVLATM